MTLSIEVCCWGHSVSQQFWFSRTGRARCSTHKRRWTSSQFSTFLFRVWSQEKDFGRGTAVVWGSTNTVSWTGQNGGGKLELSTCGYLGLLCLLYRPETRHVPRNLIGSIYCLHINSLNLYIHSWCLQGVGKLIAVSLWRRANARLYILSVLAVHRPF